MTNPSSATSFYTLRPDVVATVLHDGAVLLDLESKFFYSLNATGWAIAQQFEDGASRAEVHRHCLSLGATASELAAVDALIDTLLSHNLLDTNQNSARVPEPEHAAAQPAARSWMSPTVLKHAQPLQRVMVTAFDPGIPFTE